jgi:3-hydroxyisobutyrate dehydrogenase-like beta-hydroxyacid dehydrogenase
MTDLSNKPQIALIGLGEVGAIFAQAITEAGYTVLGFDHDAAALARFQGKRATSISEVVSQAGLVISAVTASQAVAVAQAVAACPSTEQAFYLDLNSASPSAKQQAAALLNAQGYRYVEAAVMNSVPPPGIKVPMRVGGPYAAAAMPLLCALGMQPEDQQADYGTASAVKMCRSVMIKGLEALVIESYTSALHYGVADEVIASLQETYPTIDWEQQGDYFFSRVIQHGQRRSEEMVESAATVREAGLLGLMPAATAQVQAQVAALKKLGLFDEPKKLVPWRERAAKILAKT